MSSPYALILIDVINDFDFPAGSDLLQHALPAARQIAGLKKRAVAAQIPVIYVNDNYGHWRSDFQHLVKHCSRPEAKGREIVELLKPTGDDYFVIKPKHSGFYSTSLNVLLESLGARRLILAGFAADICVLYTANDAYMRDYELIVPQDCIASETETRYNFALEHIEHQLKADVAPADQVKLG